MKRSLNLVSSILKAPCNDLARGFFLSATGLFYRIALIYYQFTFGDTEKRVNVEVNDGMGLPVIVRSRYRKAIEILPMPEEDQLQRCHAHRLSEPSRPRTEEDTTRIGDKPMQIRSFINVDLPGLA